MENEESEESRKLTWFSFLNRLPYTPRNEICEILDSRENWKCLAGALGYNTRQIEGFMKALHRFPGMNSPTEDLLSDWSQTQPTLDTFYKKLRKLRLKSAAAVLRKLVEGEQVAEQSDTDSEPVREASSGESCDESCDTVSSLPEPELPKVQGPPSPSYTDVSSPTPPGELLGQVTVSAGCLVNGHTPPTRPMAPPSVSVSRVTQAASPGGGMRKPLQAVLPGGEIRHTQAAPPGVEMGRLQQAASPGGDMGRLRWAALPGGEIRQRLVPGTRIENVPPTGGLKIPVSSGQRLSPADSKSDSSLLAYSRDESVNHCYHYDDMKKATYGFARELIIKQGPLGTVYRGSLQQRKVAITRIESMHEGEGSLNLTRMSSELESLLKLNHPHLVPFHGYSAEEKEGEFFVVSLRLELPSLQHLLETKERLLPPTERLAILTGVVEGLTYLHTASPTPVVHGLLRSCTVLVDAVSGACLSDWGLRRAVSNSREHQTGSHINQLPHWERGPLSEAYTAPGEELGTAADVYSFGLVIYECCTGEKPVDERREGGMFLKNYIDNRCGSGSPMARYQELCDPFLRSCWSLEAWDALLQIGHQCTASSKIRPTAPQVLEKLKGLDRGGIQERVDRETLLQNQELIQNHPNQNHPNLNLSNQNQLNRLVLSTPVSIQLTSPNFHTFPHQINQSPVLHSVYQPPHILPQPRPSHPGLPMGSPTHIPLFGNPVTPVQCMPYTSGQPCLHSPSNPYVTITPQGTLSGSTHHSVSQILQPSSGHPHLPSTGPSTGQIQPRFSSHPSHPSVPLLHSMNHFPAGVAQPIQPGNQLTYPYPSSSLPSHQSGFGQHLGSVQQSVGLASGSYRVNDTSWRQTGGDKFDRIGDFDQKIHDAAQSIISSSSKLTPGPATQPSPGKMPKASSPSSAGNVQVFVGEQPGSCSDNMDQVNTVNRELEDLNLRTGSSDLEPEPQITTCDADDVHFDITSGSDKCDLIEGPDHLPVLGKVLPPFACSTDSISSMESDDEDSQVDSTSETQQIFLKGWPDFISMHNSQSGELMGSRGLGNQTINKSASLDVLAVRNCDKYREGLQRSHKHRGFLFRYNSFKYEDKCLSDPCLGSKVFAGKKSTVSGPQACSVPTGSPAIYS